MTGILLLPHEVLVNNDETMLDSSLEASLELYRVRVRAFAINEQLAARLVALQYADGRLQHRVVHF